MEKHYTILVLAILLIGIAQRTFAQCPKDEAAALAEDSTRSCRKECATNADCSGAKSCNCDDLCGMSCFNPDADCQEVLTLTDGTITYSVAQNYSSQATHTCNSGFYLSGQKVRICRSTRAWSHSNNVPNCTQGCLTPLTSLGNAFLSEGEIMGASAYPVGHVITYQCRTGYLQSGDMTRTCQADYTWTNAQFTCTIVSCGAPPSISNGSPSGTDYNFGATVVYSCDTGYNLNGQASFQCRSSGRWEPEDSWPTCEPVTCLPPAAPVNGDVVASAPYEFGNIATYSCDPGRLLNGPTTGTCDENGSWGTVPTCDPTLNADFDDGFDGYTVVSGTWDRKSVNPGSDGLPTIVLAGDGIVRSLAYPLTGDEKVCMEAAVRKIGANELKAEAYNGATTKPLHTFTATGDTWNTEKFWLEPVVSTDTTVQLQFVSTNVNAELDNIKQLDASACASITTTPIVTSSPTVVVTSSATTMSMTSPLSVTSAATPPILISKTTTLVVTSSTEAASKPTTVMMSSTMMSSSSQATVMTSASLTASSTGEHDFATEKPETTTTDGAGRSKITRYMGFTALIVCVMMLF